MLLGSPIAKGNTADIFLSDGKIIKMFHARFPEGEAEYEANNQRTAYLSGLLFLGYMKSLTLTIDKQS